MESFAQPESAPCPPELPECAHQVLYRTHFRPTYKIGYKTVTELEWRCCPGYQGQDCMEVKDIRQTRVERLHHVPSASGYLPNLQASSHRTESQRNYPIGGEWQFGGHTGNRAQVGQRGPESDQHLEQEVQRLSQMVLDMQASMTDMASNLRLDFQEDASKMLVSLLDDFKQPASARGAETQTIQVQDFSLDHENTQMDDVMNKMNQVMDELESKSNTLDDLLGRVNSHDGQIRLLMEGDQTSPHHTPPPASPTSDLQAYLDSKISALREELMEGMEIKMADLKSSCDYKILSVQEKCEGQETNYFSLAELMDSKEGDLHNEIQDLRAKVADLGRADSVGSESVLARLDSLEAHLNSSDKTLKAQCLSVEKSLRNEQDEAVKHLKKTLEDKLASMEDKLANLLVDTSSAFPSDGQNRGVGPLQEDVKTLKDSVEILKQRVNGMDHLCSRECRSNLTALENLQQDFDDHKAAVETMKTNLNGQISDVESMKGQLLNHSSSIESINEKVRDLKGRLESMEESILDVILQQSLRNLYPSEGQVKAGEKREAKELLDLHRAQQKELGRRLDELRREVKAEVNRCKETTQDVGDEIAKMDSRIVNIETLCNKLEPISNSLLRIQEGLNNHVTGLWTCVNQLNSTVGAHAQDIGGLKGTCHTIQNHISNVDRDLRFIMNSSPGKEGELGEVGPPAISPSTFGVSAGLVDHSLPQLHVMETGEAGPPGKMTSSMLPEGADSSTMTVQGFAGAPASPVKSKDSLKTSIPLITDRDMPLRPPLLKPVTAPDEKVSFSAGLTLPPFQEAGIIRFNKVLVNDGGHYDPQTGIFTAPTDGRYLVTAVLAAQTGEKAEAVLSVSDHSVQKLGSAGFLSETEPHQQCSCSSSTSLSLVVQMKRGDQAGLVLTAGRLAVSDSAQVLSSFSVVLLYANPVKR